MKNISTASKILSALVFVSMLVALGAVFLYVPMEKVMGDTQRIFYFHVPAAISAFVCFFLVFPRQRPIFAHPRNALGSSSPLLR